MENDDKSLFIGQLARQSGVTTDTIRYYERIGLMPRTRRSASGYRLYASSAAARLQFIQKAQAFGFSLDEIQTVLNLRGTGKLPCSTVIELAETRLQHVERQLATLNILQESLRKNLRKWKRKSNQASCAASQFCNLIEELVIEEPAQRNLDFAVGPSR